MSREEYLQLTDLFSQMLKVPPSERESALESACGDATHLREPLEAMLKQDEYFISVANSAGFTIEAVGLLAPLSQTEDDILPEYFDSFRIVRRIGSGAMGVVYEAQQDSPSRTVALKTIRPGFVTKSLVKRFEFEIQTLTRLRHSGIAQIYETGVIERDGSIQPYYTMELVEGQSLTQHVQECQSDDRGILELFIQICDVVQFAHTRGVIHRDLKPDNILIVTNAANIQPKILDFGIARAIDADIQLTTLYTMAGQLMGTVAYMSPEQAAGNPADIDVRTDVYALGVILFELLAGCYPYQFQDRNLYQAIRIVSDEIPTRLGHLERRFRGDVEKIVAKSLEKDRTMRYQSVSDLAEDLRRFLDGKPVSATPPSVRYRLVKFAKRNKPATLAAIIALLMLGLGVAGTLVGLIRAERGLSEAVVAQSESESVTSFFEELFKSARPETQGKDVLVVDIMDEAASTLSEKFSDRPSIQARLCYTIGITYRSLGQNAKAEEQLRLALELRTSLPRPNRLIVASIQNDLGQLYISMNRQKQAEQLLTSAHDTRSEILGPHHELTLLVAHNLGMSIAFQGRFQEAERITLSTLNDKKRWLGPDHIQTIDTLNSLGALYIHTGRYEDAVPIVSLALEARIRVEGENSRYTITTKNNLAVLYHKMGQLTNAEQLYREVVRSKTELLGADHSDTLVSSSQLGSLLLEQHRLEEAERLLQEVMPIQRQVDGPGHPRSLETATMLAKTYLEQNQLAKAMEVLSEILPIADDSPSIGQVLYHRILLNHAICLFRLQDYELAESEFKRVCRAVDESSGQLQEFKSTAAQYLEKLNSFQDDPKLLGKDKPSEEKPL